MDFDLLPARVSDAVSICRKTSLYKEFGFLSAEQVEACERIAKGLKAKYCFFGGFESATRQMFIALPEWADCTDGFDIISALTFKFKKEYKLSHRDFLGTLMSLGITRESIGDILVEEGRAVVFCTTEIAPYIKQQLSKVGGVGVEISDGFCGPLPLSDKKVQKSATVASLRLDSVISALANTSREKAKQLITDGFVKRSGALDTKVTSLIKQGDSLSIKGFGRYNIEQCNRHTKSGRIVLNFSKHI